MPHTGCLSSYNGPQFTANEFSDFMKANGVKHIRTAPYHPASNGEAERFVQTFKHSLKAGKNDSGTLHQKLTRFLLTYRSTPHSTTGVSPAELFLKHQLRTRLDILRLSLERKVALNKRTTTMHTARLVSFLLDRQYWLKTFKVNRSG